MPVVDFIYAADCPNVGETRANLLRAFVRHGITPRWQEHAIEDAETPVRVRGFGSPTILVDGTDVGGITPGSDGNCRIYASDTGSPTGVPPVARIAARLGAAGGAVAGTAPPPRDRNRIRSTLAVLPGVGVALMPKLACPLCWPAYAGILSAMGLGFLMEARWLLSISSALLAVALFALALEAAAGNAPSLALDASHCVGQRSPKSIRLDPLPAL